MEKYEDLLLAYGRSRSYVEPCKSLLEGRSEQVESMLLSGKSERTISQELGYSLVTSFRAAWRRMYGVSPRKWAASKGVEVPRHRSVRTKKARARQRFVLGFQGEEAESREWDGCTPHPDADVI